jgi:Fe-S-cluster containining protein
MEETSYPCTGCGACCHRIGSIVESWGLKDLPEEDEMHFPYGYNDTGKCEMLDRDNKCLVYDNRPTICNVEKMFALMDIPRDTFYKLNINACNNMMDEDNIHLDYRIKTI